MNIKSGTKEICPHCGCDLDVEREVFAKDKLFTGHSCQGSVICQMCQKQDYMYQKDGKCCYNIFNRERPYLKDCSEIKDGIGRELR